MQKTVATPGIRARFARAGDGPGPPDPLTGFGIVGVEESANARFGAGNADDDFAVDRERSGGEVVTLLVVVDNDIPADHSGFRVERDQMAIYGSEKNRVVENRHAAIHRRRSNHDYVGGMFGV